MSKNKNQSYSSPSSGGFRPEQMALVGGLALVVLVIGAVFVYVMCRVEVKSKYVAVLIHRTGKDLPSHMEIAPSDEYKGVQLEVMREGRAFLSPYSWGWKIIRQAEVPEGQVGVLVRLYGDDLPPGSIIASSEDEKGIVAGNLKPGRYPEYSNPYAYSIEMHPALTIPAGFQGVVTQATGKVSTKPNQLLVEPGARGVQEQTLDPGTYYLNPYEKMVSLVDCRTKRLGLSEDHDMGFPSSDGFWIRLDGTVQFSVIPEKAAEIFVNYNDEEVNGDDVEEEIVQKIIMPNARAFCRLKGSTYTGRDFIDGKTREEFQSAFEKRLADECKPKGIKIESALISKIFPPEKIAEPVRRREYLQLQREQFTQEITEQQSKARTITAQMEIERQSRLKEAERKVVKMETLANQEFEVAKTEAEKRLSVALKRLEAAKDKAEALIARGKADADVIRLNNEAEVSGLKASVEAFEGKGGLFAQHVFLKKLAPAYQQILANSDKSPFVDIFHMMAKQNQGLGSDVVESTPNTPPANSTTPVASAAQDVSNKEPQKPVKPVKKPQPKTWLQKLLSQNTNGKGDRS